MPDVQGSRRRRDTRERKKDADAVAKFKEYIDDLLQQEDKANALAEALKKLAMPDAANALVHDAKAYIGSSLSVELCAEGTIERSQGKAKRVMDLRKL